ncbi:DUF2059 domain-containing protein [Algoriphagus antarcticus]|uniref:DUF2059 domain-containing protein n=1 Tax=Algoriphagus antarcticus TaxID=238540 RepID=A0A3E0DSH9_9BACT|nr:DUF2059 domain-containing protein [Algoriphagus antarcticus]REG85443.1 hypothetical protein C8N25_113135 [Algoriphagus antarcticus]
MKKLLLILFFVGHYSISHAQEASIDRPVIQLLKAMKMDRTVDAMVDQMAKSPTFASKEIPDEIWDEFKKEFSSEKLIELTAPIYEKHYTDSEIVELLEFYKSPIGLKTIEVSPAIATESMSIGQEFGMEVGQKIVQKLSKLGYIKTL